MRQFRFTLMLVSAAWLTMSAVEPAAGQPMGPKLPKKAAQDDERPTLVLDTGGHSKALNKIVFTPDGKKLISAAEDDTVQIWDVQTGQRLQVIHLPTPSPAQRLLLDPTGQSLALCASSIHHFDYGAAHFVVSLATGQTRLAVRSAMLSADLICFAPDGKSLVFGQGHNFYFTKAVMLRADFATGKSSPLHWPIAGMLREFSLSPSGKNLATLTMPTNLITVEDKIDLVDPVSFKIVHELQPKGNIVGWADDQTLLATKLLKDGNTELKVWDAAFGQLRETQSMANLRKHFRDKPAKSQSSNFKVMPVPATKKVFVIGMGQQDKVDSLFFNWDTAQIEKGPVLGPPAGDADPDLPPVAISANGKLIAWEARPLHEIVLWNIAEGKEVLRLKGSLGGSGRSIGWSADGKSIAWERSEVAPVGAPPRDAPAYQGLDLSLLSPTRVSAEDFKTYHTGKKTLGILSLKNTATGFEIVGGAKPIALALPADIRDKHEAAFTLKGVVFLQDQESLRLVNPNTGETTSELKAPRKALRPINVATAGGKFRIRSMAVSPDQRLVLVNWSDQTLTLHRPPQLDRTLLTIFPLGNDWIAVTPEGYYAASAGGERLMGWLTNNGRADPNRGIGPDKLPTFHPLERFRKKLYRPDVIKLLLELGSVEEALKAANAAAGIEKTRDVKIEELLPPRSVLALLQQEKANVKLKVQAEASAKDQPVTALRLLVDGRPLADGAAQAKFEGGKKQAGAEWNVTLPPGKHLLTVLARSPDASSKSNSIEVVVADPGKQNVLHVLAIGVNDYEDGTLKLNFAVKDAQDIAGGFRKSSGELFSQVHSEVLINAKARKETILKHLAELRKKAGPNDLAVIYFAGHGVKQKDKFYLLSVEAKTDDLAKTALSGEELRKALGEFPCQVLLMLDACHSSGGVKNFRPAVDDITRNLTDDDCGVAVMCAAMAHEKALEKEGNGLFTRAVVQALGRAEGVPYNRHNRMFFVHHLQAYVYDEVSQQSGDRQHPFLSLPWVVESFPVAKFTPK